MAPAIHSDQSYGHDGIKPHNPQWGFSTQQLHAGQRRGDPTTNAKAVPIYLTSSFIFDTQASGADLFDIGKSGGAGSNIYSRIGNPTCEVFEERIAMLEGGSAAVSTSSGQSAQFMAISTICESGDNIVTTPYLYGGTHNQLKVLLSRFGIEARFAASDKPADLEKLIDEKTKAVYIESISNPRWNVPDIPAIARLAKSYGIVTICDNTFGAGGYLCKPIDLGVDIVVESATKWIGGHGTVIAGVVIDGGRFDWGASKRYPSMTEPLEGTHGGGNWLGASLIGKRFWEVFGNKSFAMRLRFEILKDMGACLSPFNAFMCLQGLETLSLRVQRTVDNALALAQWLESHPKCAWVSYPGLESHESHERAKELLHNGFGGVLSLGVRGDGGKFTEALQLASHLANVGDARTLVIHPASTTHAALGDEELQVAGIGKDMLRVSVGIEDLRDIVDDFRCAFEAI
ncbi:O-acetylhomoserine/O-acetylserine sulfhydrylase [Ceraceosorus guamensis]|uniref:O-acetylhomoserine/O-acetylserine sulfhydrylase n=1 Tax=Ceraceosorus guamensis TaxID=1522189 RepID=A0A316VU17_9BASI|nr:O-acetylhomoserine/O-acetylserine sulfhydrylase [Ceraceosorus guamensis]PWN39005.1 O-acetylhomoserine/O-acetylserine sulfhydrylase [Ceraceosorus guamensis]